RMTFQIATGVWLWPGRIALRWQLSADGGTPNSPTAAVTVPPLRTASLSATRLSAFKIRYCCKMTPPTLIPGMLMTLGNMRQHGVRSLAVTGRRQPATSEACNAAALHPGLQCAGLVLPERRTGSN